MLYVIRGSLADRSKLAKQDEEVLAADRSVIIHIEVLVPPWHPLDQPEFAK
jgi:hypothetical protein